MTKLIVAFLNFSNTPKVKWFLILQKYIYIYIYIYIYVCVCVCVCVCIFFFSSTGVSCRFFLRQKQLRSDFGGEEVRRDWLAFVGSF